MDDIQLGNTGIRVSPIGYGAFKIGRNQQIKYREQYEIPDERATDILLNQLLDMGIN
jgi:aryl-alcohol dehydrogenase-like predicted oxidoreductase